MDWENIGIQLRLWTKSHRMGRFSEAFLAVWGLVGWRSWRVGFPMHDYSRFLHLPSAAELHVRESTWQHVAAQENGWKRLLEALLGWRMCVYVAQHAVDRNVVFSRMCQATGRFHNPHTHLHDINKPTMLATRSCLRWAEQQEWNVPTPVRF